MYQLLTRVIISSHESDFLGQGRSRLTIIIKVKNLNLLILRLMLVNIFKQLVYKLIVITNQSSMLLKTRDTFDIEMKFKIFLLDIKEECFIDYRVKIMRW